MSLEYVFMLRELRPSVQAPPAKQAAALDYAARGWHVLQVHSRSKNPVADTWQTVATTDVALIKRWWPPRARWNLGVQLGPRSGIIDVECDSPEAEQELAALLGDSYPVVPTFRGKRGSHRLFLHQPGLPRADKAVFKFRGIEFRTGNGGKGAQSLFPPSIHPDGPAYTWLVLPDDADPVPFPAAALDIIRTELETPARQTADDPDGMIREGIRNLRLTSMAGAMRRAGFNQDEMAAALLAVNRRRCDPPLGKAEVEGIARSVSRYLSNAPELSRIVRSGVVPTANRQRARRHRGVILCRRGEVG
jgi:putative DNA primase/helicase